MCIMGPDQIKDDVYDVMTNSRELTNYCQESVNSIHSKKISYSLNNFHLQNSIDLITKSLINKEISSSEFKDINFNTTKETKEKPIYNKVIDYIENNLVEYN